jgi:hypothetical protein
MKLTKVKLKIIERTLEWVKTKFGENLTTPIELESRELTKIIGRPTDPFPKWLKEGLLISPDKEKPGQGKHRRYFVNIAFYNLMETNLCIHNYSGKK